MGIFSQNSGFVKFVNKALDILWLNILWIVFCVPIVTIGASTCAAYYVSLKMVDEEEGYIGKMFIKAFKENFKYGTFMWIIDAPLFYGLYLIWQLIFKSDDVSFIIIAGAILLSVLVFAVSIYTYPLIARYRNKFFNYIKNSIGLCILYFWRTLLILALIIIEILIISWNKWTLFVGILIGPEFIIYTVTGISKRIFQKVEAQEQGSQNAESAVTEDKEEKGTAPSETADQ